jgi:hypothetical protein
MRGQKLTNRLVTITAVLMVAGALVGIDPGIARASTCVGWTGTQPENPSAGDTLVSVADPTPCNVWAVGSKPEGEITQTLTEHFNGLTWSPVASSNPGGSSADNAFNGVAVRSPSDAWAVGEYFNGRADQTLIELLSGGVWEQVSSVNPAGPNQDNILSAVTIESARNAWAVGSYTTGTQTRSLIEHWNGGTWRQLPSPNPSSTETQLTGVTATSAKNAWAVGFYVDGDTFAQTLILHWNGSTWRRMRSPDVGGPTSANSFSAVAAASGSAAWAVGGSATKGHPGQVLIARWNGRKWRRLDVASLDRPSIDGSLTGVTVLSAKDAWAVGSYGTFVEHTLAAHWNGTRWALVPSPDLGTFNQFTAVAASSPSDIWAAGYYNAVGPDFAMAFHWG